MEKAELKQKIQELEKELHHIRKELFFLEIQEASQTEWKDDKPELSKTCTKCGMVWEGVMAYCCPDSECPIQFKTTC